MQNKLFIAISIIVVVIAVIILFLIKNNMTLVDKNTNESSSTSTDVTQKSIKIVAFGDSLTAGYGVDLRDSYPAILQEKLAEQGKNVGVVNMGVSGETTTGGLDRVQFVINQKPDIVLLGLGANDMLRASSPANAKANLEKIIIALQAQNIKIVLLGMQSVANNGTEYKKNFNAIYPDLAKKYNLPLVPFFLEGVAIKEEYNTQDGIHPNRAGYELIVDDNILPVLLPLLK